VRGRSAAIQTGRTPDIVVVGAGAFGMWTALNLQRLGARVTVAFESWSTDIEMPVFKLVKAS